MENLNTEIKSKIIEMLETSRIGASSSEIAKKIGHNRVTVSKYLEIMKAHNMIDYEDVAQAKLWSINRKSQRPTILIVDDEPHIVELVSLSLIPEKFSILKAYSGIDALEKIYSESPDLIILDLMMPGINGYEICQKLKDNALTRHIPIIILSAKGEIDDKLRGLQIGADDYITKPFDPMELEARVESVVRRSGKDLDTHPLTKFPGIQGIKESLGRWMEEGMPFSVSNLRMMNFEQYSKRHGYRKAENAVILFSRMISDLFKGSDEFFIGHTLKDDFVMITGDDNAAEEVRQAFERMVPFLSGEDKAKDRLELAVRTIKSGDIHKKKLKVKDVLSHLEVKG